MLKRVYAKFRLEGFHNWKDAGKHSTEGYLSNNHRHIFHFKISAEVGGDNREIEFISMGRVIKSLIQAKFANEDDYCVFGEMSCEMIANEVIPMMQEKYGNRTYMVDVSEDGENGCVIIG